MPIRRTKPVNQQQISNTLIGQVIHLYPDVSHLGPQVVADNFAKWNATRKIFEQATKQLVEYYQCSGLSKRVAQQRAASQVRKDIVRACALAQQRERNIEQTGRPTRSVINLYPALTPSRSRGAQLLDHDWEHDSDLKNYITRNNNKLNCAACDDHFAKKVPVYTCKFCLNVFCPRHIYHSTQDICHECRTNHQAVNDNEVDHNNVTCLAHYPKSDFVYWEDWKGNPIKRKRSNKHVDHIWTEAEARAFAKLDTALLWYRFEKVNLEVPTTQGWVNCDVFHMPLKVPDLMIWRAHETVPLDNYQTTIIQPWVDDAWNRWKRLKKSSRWRFWQEHDPEKGFLHVSNQRLGINCDRDWYVGLGEKKATTKSTKKLIELIQPKGLRAHYKSLRRKLEIGVHAGYIERSMLDRWYSSNGRRDDHKRLSTNFLAYMLHAIMGPHIDVSDKVKRLGFDLRCIFVSTLEVQPWDAFPDEQFGLKQLSFSSRGNEQVFERMSIPTIPGDTLILGGKASHEWYHNVPRVNANRAVCFQDRRWLGSNSQMLEDWEPNPYYDVVQTVE